MPTRLVGTGTGFFEHLEQRTLLDSSLSPPIIFQGEQSVNTVAAGDFDGDGLQDLAIASHGPIGKRLAFLRGNGDGTFEPPHFSRYPHSISHLAAADFNGDGRDELVVGGLAGTNLRSRLARFEFNDETQKLRVIASRPVPGFVQDIAILTSAGGPSHVLFAVRTQQWPQLNQQTPYLIHSIAFNAPGLPIVQAPVESTFAESRGFRATDVDADGRSDLVLTLQSSQHPDADEFTILTYRQSADPMLAGTFESPMPALTAPGRIDGAALHHDVDRDAEPDIVAASDDRVLLFRGDGSGGFLPAETLFEGPSVHDGSNYFEILGFQAGPTGEPELHIIHRHTVGGRLPSGHQSLLRFLPQDNGSFTIREAFRRNNHGDYVNDRFQMIQLTADSHADVLWLSNRHPTQVLLFTFDDQPRPPSVRNVQFYRGNNVNAHSATTGQRVKFTAIVEDPEHLIGETGGIRSTHFYLDTNNNGIIDAGDVLASPSRGRVTIGAHWPRGTFNILVHATDRSGLVSEVVCADHTLTII